MMEQIHPIRVMLAEGRELDSAGLEAPLDGQGQGQGQELLGGHGLSSGEWRRLQLARAMLAGTPTSDQGAPSVSRLYLFIATARAKD
jgi:hypothetical protein